MAKQPTQSDPTTWCFPKETLSFLKDLKTNNNGDWFTKHKTDYEQTIKKPAEEFCPLMTEALSDLTGLPHKAKIFRIYRDVRFSKDKAPYNDHLHISFLPDLPKGPPLGWHFGLEPGRLRLAPANSGLRKRHWIVTEPRRRTERRPSGRDTRSASKERRSSTNPS